MSDDSDYVIDGDDGNTFTETTYSSYGGRLCNSLKGLCLGPLLILLSVVLLIWNEGNAVTSHRAFAKASRLVVELDGSSSSSSNEDMLVHTSGTAETQDQLVDQDFGVVPTSNVLKLQRQVEQFQWVEHQETHTRKHHGGSSTRHTTYRYYQEWRDYPVDSGMFHSSSSHENPGYFEYQSQDYVADPVTLLVGEQQQQYTLSSSVLDKINWFTTVSESSLSVDNIQVEDAKETAQVISGGYYIPSNQNYDSASYSSPSIGDYRITFSEIQPQTISIVAKQEDDETLSEYFINERTILLVEQGSVSAAEMFRHAQASVTLQAWIIRSLGMSLMFFGFLLGSSWISTLADVFPPLGDFVGTTMACASFIVALGLSSTIIALSWIAYRPLYAIPILLGVIAMAGIVIVRRRKAKQQYENGTTATVFPPLTVLGTASAPTTSAPFGKPSEQLPIVHGEPV
ncbi:Transmembrane protein 43 [Seminavis robusta]|uniref:Transmembrane protein 43 n=1 Tax=Seminavis robusta TaxID=568900 RepID=A0A9N8E510_9STRA|nr:Transmembrane protein 43 [Seminavis robusta]|eukprot:Sro549_g164510.1 Transmembrane protein 43 (456) ;mRNA; f:7116-8483